MPRLKVSDRSKRQQENTSRGRCQYNQRDIDNAVQLLAAAAVLAGREMQLVVASHFRSEARDVIPPSRKDLPYDGFNAVCHTSLSPRLQPDGRQSFGLDSQ